MLKALIRAQWKGSWHLVTALAVAALALPIVSIRTGWQGAGTHLPVFLSQLQLWGLFYPTLAVISAIVLSVGLWASDRRGHNIYAMLLPIPRWRYVLLQYEAGFMLLLPLVVAVWLGALIATVPLDLPPGLRTFPHALAIKFGLSLSLLFGIAFAIAATSSRTLGIAVRLLGLFLAVHIGVFLVDDKVNLLWRVVTALATWPGPFAPLGGRWMLIDV